MSNIRDSPGSLRDFIADDDEAEEEDRVRRTQEDFAAPEEQDKRDSEESSDDDEDDEDEESIPDTIISDRDYTYNVRDARRLSDRIGKMKPVHYGEKGKVKHQPRDEEMDRVISKIQQATLGKNQEELDALMSQLREQDSERSSVRSSEQASASPQLSSSGKYTYNGVEFSTRSVKTHDDKVCLERSSDLTSSATDSEVRSHKIVGGTVRSEVNNANALYSSVLVQTINLNYLLMKPSHLVDNLVH